MQQFIIAIFVIFSAQIKANSLEESRNSMAKRLHDEMEFLTTKANNPTIYKVRGSSTKLAKRETEQFLNLDDAFETQDIVKSGLAAPKRSAIENDKKEKKSFNPKIRSR